MSKILLLKGFNNYFNRTVKKCSSVQEYYYTAESAYGYPKDVNFNPNDGVNTKHVFNMLEDTYDYLILYHTVGVEEVIDSRWFIIESVRTRGGQYELTLKRDVIVDKLDVVLDAPCFVEKGMIDYNDPAMYNSEGMAFNQIKKFEAPLKDASGIPWIVGYIGNLNEDQTIEVPTETDVPYTTVSTLESWPFYKYREQGGTDYKVITKNEVTVSGNTYWSSSSTSIIGYFSDTTGKTKVSTWVEDPTAARTKLSFKNLNKTWGITKNFAQDFLSFLNNQQSRFNTIVADDQSELYEKANAILNLNGTYIRASSSNKIYRVNVFVDSTSSETISVSDDLMDSLFSVVDDYTNSLYPNMTISLESSGPQPFSVKVTTNNYRLSLEEVESNGLVTQISATANTLTDAPYKMFAIPYGAIRWHYASGSTTTTTVSEEEALNMACSIATQLGDNLYDIQLLPYCPFIEYENLIEDGIVDTANLTLHVDYDVIHEDTATGPFKSFIIYCKRSDFRTRLSYVVNVPENTEDRKLAHECAFYRLSSPNFASSFEFNVVNNGGYVDYFDVECTYKPFSPYIHVSPNFHGLYGQDFDDYRGLICSGDFSIPRMNDAWINFQLNNQNYLNTFNREIDSLETQYKYQHRNEIGAAIVGTFQGTTSGAAAGFMVGGGWGAAAGAVVGGIGSAIGAGLDVSASEALHKEQIDLQKDRFNMNLQNIQARPNTLAKASSFDINNKIFPVIELYSCTEQEQEALKNKLKYEGYTINRIGTLSEFIRSDDYYYVRGKIIKLEGLAEDFHFASEIMKEVSEGLFIRG